MATCKSRTVHSMTHRVSCPHKKYWTHRSNIQYYTITLNPALTQRQVWYAMNDWKSYCTRKMAASQPRTVHSKTHRVCPIHTRNIGPTGPLSSTRPSPWIQPLTKGSSDMPWKIERATVTGKWLRPNHVRYIPRLTGSVLSTQKYWTHRSNSQYYTITLNRALTQRQVWYVMRYWKSYCTRKMAASQSRTVHSKTHMVSPIHTRNIGPTCPLSSTRPPWIRPLTKGSSDMPWKIERATVPGKWLRPNHVWYIPRTTVSVLSTQEILDPSVHYPVLDRHLESSPYPKAGLICHEWFKELMWQENGCVPITYGTFQDPHGLSSPHKKYWTHRSNIKYYITTLNRASTQGQVWYAMRYWKSYCTRKWLRPNYERYIPRPTEFVLSTQEILDPSV